MSNFQIENATEGEYFLYTVLQDHFANIDGYKVFFQPFINGLQADIIVYKKNTSPILIEVKDWNESSYDVPGNIKTEWSIKSNGVKLTSPFKQIDKYKDTIYTMLDGFYSKKLNNEAYFGIIKGVLYFHNFKQESIKRFDDKYIKVFTKESINDLINYIKSLPRNNILLKDTELENNLLSIFETGFNRLYDYKKRNPMSDEILEKINIKSKARGTAGSGKTYELASYATFLVEKKN